MTEATEVFAGDGKPTWDVGCVFFGLVGLPKKRVCFLKQGGDLVFFVCLKLLGSNFYFFDESRQSGWNLFLFLSLLCFFWVIFCTFCHGE